MTTNNARMNAIRRILGLLEKLDSDEQRQIMAMVATLIKPAEKLKPELSAKPLIKKRRRKAKVET